jgi:hypothetical protein
MQIFKPGAAADMHFTELSEDILIICCTRIIKFKLIQNFWMKGFFLGMQFVLKRFNCKLHSKRSV